MSVLTRAQGNRLISSNEDTRYLSHEARGRSRGLKNWIMTGARRPKGNRKQDGQTDTYTHARITHHTHTHTRPDVQRDRDQRNRGGLHATTI